MSIFFANPIGLSALLGLPLLLAIYFFQRRSKEYLAPTLFLIIHQFEHKSGGKQFKRFQPSWALFLQILALILLTFLLAQPRIKKSQAIQPVAIVLDASASMAAFRKDAIEEVERCFTKLEKEGNPLSIQLFESVPESPALYSGTSREEALLQLIARRPIHGMIDPAHALNLARSRLGNSGTLIYITDHVPSSSLPANTKVISVGRPLQNMGFCGMSVKKENGQHLAKALVKNYGTLPEERAYKLLLPNGVIILEKAIQLKPGQAKTLSFPLTKERPKVIFALAPDDFTLDDTAPILLPSPKAITISHLQRSPEIIELTTKLAAALGAPEPKVSPDADLVIQSSFPQQLTLPATNSITFIKQAKGAQKTALTEAILPSSSALLQDLIWDTLIVPKTARFTLSTKDETLLWAGNAPLISLRSTSYAGDIKQHLLCHFSLEGSNFQTQTNLAILFFRFAQRVREAKSVYFEDLGEVNQPLSNLSLPKPISPENPLVFISALNKESRPPISSNLDLRLLTLPATPDIITLKQGNQDVATIATHFADTREADFSKATTNKHPKLISKAEMRDATQPLPYSSLFILLLITICLLIWHLLAPKHSTVTV